MFPSEVTEKLGYYVYRLIDPRSGETFYVGKGKGNRVFNHVSDALSVSEDETGAKLSRIRQIRLDNFEVLHVIHRHGLETENAAYEVEAALMEAYPGLTNIMGGHQSDAYGVAHAEQLIRRYTAPEAEFLHPIVMLNVGRLSADAPLYEVTRYAWRIDLAKARLAQYVLPVSEGIIRGAFVAQEWLPATPENFPTREPMPGRFGFVGPPAAGEIIALYSHKRVPSSFRKRGAANPVRYALDC